VKLALRRREVGAAPRWSEVSAAQRQTVNLLPRIAAQRRAAVKVKLPPRSAKQ